jgi:hypothetical protein
MVEAEVFGAIEGSEGEVSAESTGPSVHSVRS